MLKLDKPIVRLAVVSDMHAFTSPDKNKDSVLDLSAPGSRLANPLTDLIATVNEKEIRADALICAGDICNQADFEGLQRAWEKLHDLKTTLEAVDMIATCGNHDLDSRYLDKEADPDPKGFLLSLKPSFPFPEERLNDKFWARNFAVTKLKNGVVAVSLNTSAFHGGKPEEIDHGRVSSRTIAALKTELASTRGAPAHILVCHHHPMPQSGWRGASDHEYILNGQILLDELTKSTDSSWLVIHGHRHYPRLIHGASSSNQVPFIFGAASLGARIAGVPNQFHMVDLYESSEGDHASMVGVVRTWSWTDSSKWTLASGPAGLPSTCGFGYRGQIGTLAREISTIVGDSFSSWNCIRSRLPSVDLLMPDSLVTLERDLEERGIKMLRDRDGQPAQVGR